MRSIFTTVTRRNDCLPDYLSKAESFLRFLNASSFALSWVSSAFFARAFGVGLMVLWRLLLVVGGGEPFGGYIGVWGWWMELVDGVGILVWLMPIPLTQATPNNKKTCTTTTPNVPRVLHLPVPSSEPILPFRKPVRHHMYHNMYHHMYSYLSKSPCERVGSHHFVGGVE